MSDSIRAFIPCDGLIIDGDLVDGKIVGQWQQDIKNGAALRRLREALPEGYSMRVEASRLLGDEPQWTCWVWSFALEPMKAHHSIGMTGDTIAEAADKCWEALTPDSTDEAEV